MTAFTIPLRRGVLKTVHVAPLRGWRRRLYQLVLVEALVRGVWRGLRSRRTTTLAFADEMLRELWTGPEMQKLLHEDFALLRDPALRSWSEHDPSAL